MQIHILFTVTSLRSPGPGEASLHHYLLSRPGWLVLIDGKCAGDRDHVIYCYTSDQHQEPEIHFPSLSFLY